MRIARSRACGAACTNVLGRCAIQRALSQSAHKTCKKEECAECRRAECPRPRPARFRSIVRYVRGVVFLCTIRLQERAASQETQDSNTDRQAPPAVSSCSFTPQHGSPSNRIASRMCPCQTEEGRKRGCQARCLQIRSVLLVGWASDCKAVQARVLGLPARDLACHLGPCSWR